MEPKYKRILLKISGEGLAGADKTGINDGVLRKLCAEITAVYKAGVQICLVIGGGNFFRGAKNAVGGMDRSEADQIGMLATVMNAAALRAALRSAGCKVKVFSGLSVPEICETYNFRQAIQAVENGEIVIFAGGTGSPYFTTDTGAALRAVEMHCDILMKATQVDGVYDADPRFNPEAKRYETVSFSEVLEKHLNVMDMTAIAMARDNNLPVMIFAQAGENAIINAVCGSAKSTIIKS
ncbi:MAG: UMP kinase [Alphaproteobacteria bacterium]|jgi:uridylate kinase|nr:UMP kinase [Alphaproteobacteria bacterium]